MLTWIKEFSWDKSLEWDIRVKDICLFLLPVDRHCCMLTKTAAQWIYPGQHPCPHLSPVVAITGPPVKDDFPGGLDRKASVYNAGRPRFDPWVRKFPGEGKGNPLQYSCLENPMDRGAWCPWGHRVRQDWATSHFHSLKTHTIILFKMSKNENYMKNLS